VVDTGPIKYLMQIGHIDLLSTLVDKTVFPCSVRSELLNGTSQPPSMGRKSTGVG
jgi:hypothetical protein